jgi:hypothetical protein
MTTEVAQYSASSTATAGVRERGHIGLIVLGAIASIFRTIPASTQPSASSPRELRANRNEFLELPTVFEQAKALKSLGDKPLAVLSADRGEQRGWANYQDKLARRSTNSIHRIARGSTHSALLEEERFASITTRAISDVVRSAGSGQPLR